MSHSCGEIFGYNSNKTARLAANLAKEKENSNLAIFYLWKGISIRQRRALLRDTWYSCRYTYWYRNARLAGSVKHGFLASTKVEIAKLQPLDKIFTALDLVLPK